MRSLSMLLLFICFYAQSQSYTVIHTIGKIYDAKSGKYLAKGLKISEDANLKFETLGARAAVLSSARGRFVIQETEASTSQSDALYALSSVISPVRGRLSTRAGSINNALDFQKHFGDGAIALVGSKYRVTVSPASYPMSESNFFYAQYAYNGETINKKLGNVDDKLVIETNSFYSVDGSPIDHSLISDIKLFYFKAEDQTSSFITNLNLTVVSDEELKSLLEQFQKNSKEAVLELINSMYGKCTEEQLKQAINEL
ncbi:hypothetical protein [Ekhidna sp. To15]|uniref:hypothetical protein n=1 Tax=Ekhidna sp. To15 TaxID=3395267 RepID=UPI003F52788C